MQYKTELHVHTKEVSPCSDMPAARIVDRYIAAGYSALVVTDHYCDYVIDQAGDTWEEKINRYLSGYRAMKEYAGDRIKVLLGCELRFVGSINDYLIFGITEEFLINHPDLHKSDLRAFRKLANENGLLIVQAHPFRNGMVVMDPALLDGVEIFNGHRGHDSRNKIAEAWSRRYHLLRTSGSDFHHENSVESGGLLTDFPIDSTEKLVETIRTGNATLICRGPSALLDGMTDTPAKID